MSTDKENAELRRQLAEMQIRLTEAEETLEAIRAGEVDALVVQRPDGDKVYTLEGAETPYRFLVEEMNEGALLLSTDGTVLYANMRFATLAGRPLEKVIGEHWAGFFVEGDRELARTLTEGVKEGGIRQELHLATGSSPCLVQVSVDAIRRDGFESFSVVITDLTQSKAAEEAVRASNAKLRETVTDLEHFSYSLSHDLRAPLRAMQAYASVVEEEAGAQLLPECRDYLRRIKTAANRMDQLITESLNYSRILREEVPIRPVELGRLLQSLIETYPNLQPPGAVIQLEVNNSVVLGNEATLTQVFSNLLGNAVKFVSQGVTPKVRVWTSEIADQRNSPSNGQRRVQVWVEDNGIGIPKEGLQKIFGMFHRMHRTEDYPGTGIGLAIVRKSLDRIGGSVRVESEPGKGSRFCVELVAVHQPTTEPPPPK